MSAIPRHNAERTTVESIGRGGMSFCHGLPSIPRDFLVKVVGHWAAAGGGGDGWGGGFEWPSGVRGFGGEFNNGVLVVVGRI